MQKCVNKKVKIIFTTSGITTVFTWTGVFYREIKHSRAHSWYQYDHHIQERRAVFFLCNTWCGDIEQLRHDRAFLIFAELTWFVCCLEYYLAARFIVVSDENVNRYFPKT